MSKGRVAPRGFFGAVFGWTIVAVPLTVPSGWFDDRAFRLRVKSYDFSPCIPLSRTVPFWSKTPDSFTSILKVKRTD